MALYLDSAIVSEAEIARDLGWVTGITTNPTLLANSDLPPEITLKKLAGIIPGEVFYQLTNRTNTAYITNHLRIIVLLLMTKDSSLPRRRALCLRSPVSRNGLEAVPPG